MKRILIIQTAFLGDVILATPVLSELKRIFAEAEIDVLVKKGNEGLLANHPDLHELFVFDKGKGKWKAMRALIHTFRSRHYDLAINLHRFASSGYMTVRSGAKKKYGFSANPLSVFYTKSFPHVIGDGTHEVNRNLSLIRGFGAEKDVRPTLYPSASEFEKVQEYKSEPYYCLAPASVWFTKQLPEEKWMELISKIGEKRIYLLGAPGDFDLCERIKSVGHAQVVNLAGKLSLLESAALMKDAERCFVNDSGPLHIASAVNSPTTAFFCSTVTDFGFGPLADDSKVLEVRDLPCRPCGIHGKKSCPRDHFKCGREIEIDA